MRKSKPTGRKNKLTFLLALIMVPVMMFCAACDNGTTGGDGDGTAEGDKYSYVDHNPEYPAGDSQFGYDGNYSAPELTIDGKADDEQWSTVPVLAVFGKEDAASVKVYRGETALFFFFDVADTNLLTHGESNDDTVTQSDSIELYIDSKADGGNRPRSDDYQINLAIHGKTRIMQGSGIEWGRWNGLVDYEVFLKGGTLNNATADDTGYSVEVLIPYSQIGIEKNDTIAVAFGQVDKTGPAAGDSAWHGWRYNGTVVEPQTINNYIFLDKDGGLESRDERNQIVIPDEVLSAIVTSGKRNSIDWQFFYVFAEHDTNGLKFEFYSLKVMPEAEFIFMYLDFGNEAQGGGWAQGSSDYQLKIYGDLEAYYRKSTSPWWKTNRSTDGHLTAAMTEPYTGIYKYEIVLPYADFGYAAGETVGFAILQSAGDNQYDYTLRNDDSCYFNGNSIGDVANQANFVRIDKDDNIYLGRSNSAAHHPKTATLNDLKINGATINSFASGTLTGYTHEFDYGVTPTSGMVTFTKTNTASAVAVAVNTGLSTITVTVTSGDGTVTKAYVIAYTNAAAGALSTDATLSGISIFGTPLADFSAGTFSYTYSLAAYNTAIAASDIAATTTHGSASKSVAINGAGTLITITVTAQDTTTTAAYTIALDALPESALINGGVNPGNFKNAIEITRDSTGTTFNFYTSRELVLGEFIMLYLDFGNDTTSAGWKQGATDYLVKIYKDKAVYGTRNANEEPWWKTIHGSGGTPEKSITATEGSAGVWKYTFVLDYTTFGYVEADVFGFFIMQAADNESDYAFRGAEIFLFENEFIGDPALQTAYLRCDENGDVYKASSNIANPASI